VFRNGWDILHGNDVWTRLFHQSVELIEKPPAWAAEHVVPLRICREGLTRGTSGKDLYPAIPEKLVESRTGHLADVLFDEYGIIIELERVSATFLDVDASYDIDALFLEAVGQSTGTAKKVNASNVLHSSSHFSPGL